MKTNSKEYKQLEHKWYKKLQDSGFKDIELNSELQPVKETIRSGHISLETAKDSYSKDNWEDDHECVNYIVGLNIDVYGEPTTVWETPNAVFWSKFSRLANALPRTYKNRAMLVELGLGGYQMDVYRKHKLNRAQFEKIVKQFKDRYWEESEEE